jgi:hypothetical protein
MGEGPRRFPIGTLLRRGYGRLGPRYPRTALAVTFRVQHVVVVTGVVVLSLYLPGALGDYLS